MYVICPGLAATSVRAESTQSCKRRTEHLFMHGAMFMLAVVRTTEGNHSMWLRNAVS